MTLLKSNFRPEFLNRLDEIVLFKPLEKGEIRQIVSLQLNDLKSRLAEQEVALEIQGPALDWLAEKGFDPVYGARPVKRAIQRELETPIARQLIAGNYPPGSTICVGVKEGALSFS